LDWQEMTILIWMEKAKANTSATPLGGALGCSICPIDRLLTPFWQQLMNLLPSKLPRRTYKKRLNNILKVKGLLIDCK
jgi:hypothetical protein